MKKQDSRKKEEKKRKIIVWKIVLASAIALIFLGKPLSAWADLVSMENRRAGDYVIRQEKRKVGSIMTIKPASVDLRILSIISSEGIRTLEDYELWLKKNIRYQSDELKDEWTEAEEMLNRKYGDCEDFAFLNTAFLHVLGYQPRVMAMIGLIGGGGHAIAVFEKDGQYLWFDNGTLERTTASSMEEFTKVVYKRFAFLGIYEIHPDEQNQSGLSEK